MCGGNTCPFLAKLATYHGCVVAANGHIVTRNEPTIGVWWKYMSISDQISHLQWVCSYYERSYSDKNTCPFLVNLITHNRCVVAINGHLMMRNGPTIGVWWKIMSISCQISHLPWVCSCGKCSYCDQKWTYDRCVVEIYVNFWPN